MTNAARCRGGIMLCLCWNYTKTHSGLNDFKHAGKMNSAESVHLSVNTLSMC